MVACTYFCGQNKKYIFIKGQTRQDFFVKIQNSLDKAEDKW